jgi:hypothetical protein
MKYDLTEKLSFDDDPVITIKDVELTVNSDAVTVLQIMDVIENEGEMAAISKCVDLLFDEKNRKKLEKLRLKAPDFIQVIQAATALAVGQDPEEVARGEA